MTVINWKSGHTTDAIAAALACISGIYDLKEIGLIGFVPNSGVDLRYTNLLHSSMIADSPHIFMLGGLCQFFFEQELYDLAVKACSYVKLIREVMTPDFDFVSPYISAFSFIFDFCSCYHTLENLRPNLYKSNQKPQ